MPVRMVSVLGIVCALGAAHPSFLEAAEDAAATNAGPSASVGSQVLPTVVVQATALRGPEIDADKLPGNVQSLSTKDFVHVGASGLGQALDARLGSISITEALGDPFQPDIFYRGFEVSPVLGTPQGLAIYQNGVRINEAFGNTVNWDLFPDFAIEKVRLVSSSPVYGLNALGGAVSLTMKDAFSYQGGEAQLSGGSYGSRGAIVQYGVNNGTFGLYLGGKALNNTGWRQYSNDSLRQAYVALSARPERGSLDLSYTHADDDLHGQGATPVQTLAVNRSLLFTIPQENVNRLDFLTLDGSLKLAGGWSLNGLLYYRQYRQHVTNGNTSNFTACTTQARAGILCQSDGLAPLTDTGGALIPDISQGGALPVGQNNTETINAYGRGASLQVNNGQSILDHANVLSIGATLDYAELNFYSDAELGPIIWPLLYSSVSLTVDTPEGGAFSATPVAIKGFDRTYAVYFTDTFDVTPVFSVTASARYNRSTIDVQDQRGTALSGSNSYDHLNPAIGGAYKISPELTVYGGFAQNTRTPTASEIECSNPSAPCLLPSSLSGDPPTLKQVIARTYELGLRGRSSIGSGAVSWNLSAFRANVSDDIFAITTSLSSGFFSNIGGTRRQGVELGLNYKSSAWTAYFNYSYVQATFRSSLLLPSPSNPFADANGDIQVLPGDKLPGIPQHRIKAGVDYEVLPNWTVGASVKFLSDSYFVGDESNQNAPLPSHHIFGLQSSYQIAHWIGVFAHVDNLFNTKYATYGIFSDPTGIGAPGIPANAVTNGPGVDNRFIAPAYPFAIYAGVRITL